MRGKKYRNKESEDLENSNGSLSQNTISVTPDSKNQGRYSITLLCICTREFHSMIYSTDLFFWLPIQLKIFNVDQELKDSVRLCLEKLSNSF
jgi:hypothetical protein